MTVFDMKRKEYYTFHADKGTWMIKFAYIKEKHIFCYKAVCIDTKSIYDHGDNPGIFSNHIDLYNIKEASSELISEYFSEDVEKFDFEEHYEEQFKFDLIKNKWYTCISNDDKWLFKFADIDDTELNTTKTINLDDNIYYNEYGSLAYVDEVEDIEEADMKQVLMYFPDEIVEENCLISINLI